MKFGGSCFKDSTAFEKILKIIEAYKDAKKVLVASALNGITDILISTAQNIKNREILDKNMATLEKRHYDIIEQIFDEESIHYSKAIDWIDEKLDSLEEIFADVEEFGLEPYYKDNISAFGELSSTYILHQYLLSKGLDSEFIPSNKLIITNDEFNNAYPFYELTNARVARLVLPSLEDPEKNINVCVTGFIGRNKLGYTTTFGRGGSDYTATILAHSLYDIGKDKDIRVILWKDVDGLFAISPKFIPKSFLIKNLDYDEAKHIANFGAKIIHPRCIEAIEKRNIPLEIRNFDKPLEKSEFTEISEYTDKSQIKGISAVENAVIISVTSGSMVDVPGVLAKIFKVMSKNRISVSLVAQSATEISTSFIVDEKEAKKAVSALINSGFFTKFFEIKAEDVAIINITGSRILENKTKIAIFQALEKENVKVKALSQSTEELNLSLVISREKLKDAIKIIHDDLSEDIGTAYVKTINEK